MRRREIERYQRVIAEARDVGDAILADEWQGPPPLPRERLRARRLARNLLRTADELEEFLIAETRPKKG